MNFHLTDEQKMLTQSLRRYLDTEYSFEARRKISRGHGAFRRATWEALAEMGILGLRVDAAHGGFGESAASMMLVQHELGRALVLEPVTPSAVMATAILQKFGTEAQCAEWLPAMARGERIVTLAYLEGHQRMSDGSISAVAALTSDGYALSGAKKLVWHGEAADAFLVSAKVGDGGQALFIVPSKAPGIEMTGYPTFDGLRACDVEFRNVALPHESRIGNVGSGQAALESGIQHGIAALCAEAGGAMERVVEMTTEFLRTRVQFGKPLASFQALQHRMADVLIQRELGTSMAYLAAQALDETDANQRRRMLAAAKYIMAKAARFVGQQAVQLHGAMGMTDELALGDYFKRLAAMEAQLGDSDAQLATYAELLVA